MPATLHSAHLAVALVLFAAPAAPPLNAQQPSSAPAIPTEIEVDQSCHIVTVDLRNPARPRPRYSTDRIICHIEGYHETLRWEETIANGTRKKRLVDIREREFLLQNPYPQAITFVVHQALPRRYHIDSDPPPSDVTNSVASFRVIADPGQTVRLHIGERD
jgi:hypothetical protein